jgi:hypothetical protein
MTIQTDIPQADIENNVTKVDDTTNETEKHKSSRFAFYINAFLMFTVAGTILAAFKCVTILTEFHLKVDKVTKDSIIATYSSGDSAAYFISLGVMVLLFALMPICIFNFKDVILPKLFIFIFFFSAIGLAATIAGGAIGGGYVTQTIDAQSIPTEESERLLESALGAKHGYLNYEYASGNSSDQYPSSVTEPMYGNADGEVYKFNKTIDGNTITWTLKEVSN